MTFAAPTAQRCLSTCTGAHTIRCALPAGHGGLHRSSPWLSWHDPPKVFVGGDLYEPDIEVEVTFSWERDRAGTHRDTGRAPVGSRAAGRPQTDNPRET